LALFLLYYESNEDNNGRTRTMAAATNQTQIGRIASELQSKTAEGARYAQTTFISELPGAVFAILTLAYVVSSLVHLA
jgi:hypothetical protein